MSYSPHGNEAYLVSVDDELEKIRQMALNASASYTSKPSGVPTQQHAAVRPGAAGPPPPRTPGLPPIIDDDYPLYETFKPISAPRLRDTALSGGSPLASITSVGSSVAMLLPPALVPRFNVRKISQEHTPHDDAAIDRLVRQRDSLTKRISKVEREIEFLDEFLAPGAAIDMVQRQKLTAAKRQLEILLESIEKEKLRVAGALSRAWRRRKEQTGDLAEYWTRSASDNFKST